MKKLLNKYQSLLIAIIILLGISLRFYNLNWGAPFYFHPDERNIAYSVTNLSFPNQMNPHFFAYGSLPIYLIYFTGIFWNIISGFSNNSLNLTQVPFENAIIISRLYSAFLSIILLFLVYRLGIILKNKTTGILALFLASTSVGLIQFAHFGTFEIWLSLFSSLLLFSLIKFIKTKKEVYFYISAIILGLLISIKISSFVLFLLPILVLLSINKFNIHKNLRHFFLLCFLAFIFYAITSPYTFIDPNAFKSSINYESKVALGTLPVFYTQGFYNTQPVIFQILKVFPFLLNPLLAIIFIPSLFYTLFLTIKNKNKSLLILNLFFIILFLSQVFFFVKWTRYMVSTLPFLYLSIAIFLANINKFKKSILLTITLISLIFSFSYFITVYIQPDSRILANIFASKNISTNAKILSEAYDLGILPFNSSFPNITLFNFYDSENTRQENKLSEILKNSDYIILPSQRILNSRLTSQKQFPKGYNFYNKLLNGKLGFTKIYQTNCDIFCKITYLNDPIFRFEETANIFDKPIVTIFKKE